MSVLLEQPASLVAYRPNKPTAMVVVADPRVRSTVTRHLWALGVRDVIEASSVAEARPRIGNPRDICVADVHLPDGSGLTLLSETRAAGWPNGLALSAADDIGAVRNALAGGVKGYVVTGTRNNVGSPAASRCLAVDTRLTRSVTSRLTAWSPTSASSLLSASSPGS
uniref:response regulator n=1 Tax=Streptomyces sp. Agncl-13 TaxID=3400628 RepID=UPI003A83F027